MLFSSVLTLTMFLTNEATAVDWPELPSSKTVENMLAGASASDAAKIAQGQLSNEESMRVQQSIQLRTELKRELKKERYRKSHKHQPNFEQVLILTPKISS